VLIAARAEGTARLSRVAGVTAADTIYQIDRLSEAAIEEWFSAHWPRRCPVEIVMEGIEDGQVMTFPHGTPVARTMAKCIIDPIDGTRNLMHDKRPAWALAGLAPQRGRRNRLSDIVVAAMTELPISKQGSADQWSAIAGGGVAGVTGVSLDLRTGAQKRIRPAPSQAKDCRHGFASLVKFFPEGKAMTARIEEELWTALYGVGGSPVIFEDQYTTTGGQLYEILVGHDRMIGDLRPLVHAALGISSSLVCHPYDICTALILTEAGGVVEHPLGGPVKAPLDTTSPVAWVGYGNPGLARTIRPVLKKLTDRYLDGAVRYSKVDEARALVRGAPLKPFADSPAAFGRFGAHQHVASTPGPQ
jgi:fructose-1,6-bisphosphatase/inositol monophosphatase family enzyme